MSKASKLDYPRRAQNLYANAVGSVQEQTSAFVKAYVNAGRAVNAVNAQPVNAQQTPVEAKARGTPRPQDGDEPTTPTQTKPASVSLSPVTKNRSGSKHPPGYMAEYMRKRRAGQK